MFKIVLERLAEFPPDVAEFIKCNTKTCDGCRYCVQTDKTGSRPLAAIRIGEEMKCPYYPGFTMNWRELTPELAAEILAVLDSINELLDEGAGKIIEE